MSPQKVDEKLGKVSLKITFLTVLIFRICEIVIGLLREVNYYDVF